MHTNAEKINFKRFDFETELAILYSSGTTGKPIRDVEVFLRKEIEKIEEL